MFKTQLRRQTALRQTRRMEPSEERGESCGRFRGPLTSQPGAMDGTLRKQLRASVLRLPAREGRYSGGKWAAAASYSLFSPAGHDWTGLDWIRTVRVGWIGRNSVRGPCRRRRRHACAGRVPGSRALRAPLMHFSLCGLRFRTASGKGNVCDLKAITKRNQAQKK